MRTNDALRISMITVITCVFALPLYLAFTNVFKTQPQILYQPIALPNPFTLSNLVQAISRPDQLLFRGLATSMAITLTSVFGVILFSSVIGYYIARHNSKRIRSLQILFLVGMMVPPQVTLIPIVRIFRLLGLMGTFQGVALFFIGGGLMSFGVFVYTGFVKNIPRELEEAAVMDGASEFEMFWQIIFPLLRPATATVAIFISLWTWNEFLAGLSSGALKG